MADYYPLLVRAISGLPQNTQESRKSVYDRARAALLKQLRSVEPPLPEGEILRERQALEDAVRRVEAEQTPAAPEPTPPEADADTPTPTAPETPVAPESPAAPSRTSADAPMPPAAGIPLPTGARPSASPAPAPETPAANTPAPQAAATHEAPAPSSEPEEEATKTRPTLGKGKVNEARPHERAQERPRLPTERESPKGPRWQRTVIVIGLIAVLIGGGAYAVVNRETLFGEGAPPAPAAPAQQAEATKPQDQPKNADRIPQSGQAPAARPAAPGPRQGLAAQRAYLFEEAQGGSQGLQTYEGTVTWKTETFTPGPGLPPDVGIRAELQIPGRLGAAFTLRRNTDAALPASHTIELSFALPADFAYGGINNVPGIRMKQTENAQGAPLAGLSVRVNPTYFLVGLSAVPVDKERNLQLLQTRPWIDVPMVYNNNKRAIIAFEKGPAGEQAFQDAFAAWGELLPPAPPPMTPVPPPPGIAPPTGN